MRKQKILYSSSVDGTSPLYVDAVYNDALSGLPIVVVMHGYRGDRFAVSDTLERLAQKGLFAVAPDMRGHGDSAGKRDSGGVELMDIYDAIVCLRESFGNRIDPGNVNIVGYSGGGGNVFSCVTKFPDLFRSANAFFGISDYAYWHEHVPQYAPQIAEDVGGAPSEVPDCYAARNSLLGVGNNPFTAIQLFHDEEEQSCPPYFNQEYKRIAKTLGYDNVALHESLVGDGLRWIHGYPKKGSDLIQAEDFFVPGMLARAYPKPTLREKQKFMVLGYLKTERFTIWLGDGQNAVAECWYLRSEREHKFTFRLRSSDASVRGELTVPLAGLKFPVQVMRNGTLVEEITSGESYTYPSFQLSDWFVLTGA
ncbi:MAG: alpha/beta fold hydrolase [Candidatus Latescibacterota bacterium]